MNGSASGSERRVRDRVVLERKVQLRYDKFQDFLSEIAGNISPGGMFVRSDDPQDIGDQFEFECSLADGYPLIGGRAEVVWRRSASTAADQPSGMGVRFLHLRDKSEGLIRRIVEQRIQAGEETFDLADKPADEKVVMTPEPPPRPKPPPVAPGARSPAPERARSGIAVEASPLQAPRASAPRPSVAPPSPKTPVARRTPASPLPAPRSVASAPPRPARKAVRPNSSAAARRPSARRRSRKPLGILRLLELVLFSGLAGAFMVLIFNQYWVRPRIERLEAKLEELTGSSSVGRAPGFARAEPDSMQPSAQSEPDRPLAETVPEAGGELQEFPAPAAAPRPRPSPQAAVQSWARAWSEKRVEDYLSCYAPDFVPASGVPRALWEERRRSRLLKQGAIRVAVVSFQVEELSPSEARVVFTQSYQSDVYRDRVRKLLRLTWNDERWQIAEESVIRQLPW